MLRPPRQNTPKLILRTDCILKVPTSSCRKKFVCELSMCRCLAPRTRVYTLQYNSSDSLPLSSTNSSKTSHGQSCCARAGLPDPTHTQAVRVRRVVSISGDILCQPFGCLATPQRAPSTFRAISQHCSRHVAFFNVSKYGTRAACRLFSLSDFLPLYLTPCPVRLPTRRLSWPQLTVV